MTRETDPLLPDEEAEWIRAAQAGEQSAFTHLINRYWDRLYRWLFHLTRDRHKAEDLTSETFLKALAALKSFRAGSNFRAWLFRIGRNNFVNLKRLEKRNAQPAGDEPPPADDAAGPEETAADREAVRAHEHDLLTYAREAVRQFNWLRVIGDAPGKGAILSFETEGMHAHDVATVLDREGVAVRAGHHCAQPLMERFGVASTSRASFAMYNTRADVDALIAALAKARKILS